MAAKTYSENTTQAFHNVRPGGPKQKRIRRVELMGEHQPLAIFYIKVAQSRDDEYLSLEVLINEFSLCVFNYY